MVANQLDLIMDQVQHLPTGEQLQLIKRVADLLGRANQSQHIEDQLAAMAADPDMQREIRQIEAELAGTETNGLKVKAARALARAASLRDFSADRQWLKDHRAEYAGQWVALKDGWLISNGLEAKEVFAAADAAGQPDALVIFVESEADRPDINLG